ncbi:ligase-associated DNA damage response exonuclease [Mucilaginibacter sp. RS28]|uniref:Ligase-associated DNA damage response exonuclease n=1 Tax=Mucilaginibacter straminoryzae TaxID=2932774 RepID=A0A9X1X9F5_9SPHI|nr:ligase-associated DNA damage response exonuclease [Mucilaginibacter straminoryzae]MCJ8210844.1 ligase-associated DNA damage response exonuclease [Mucilaginibacter straminoryzae]
MPRKPLLEFTDRGIYCPQGKFYIDPWKPVDDAVITHAHSDHAYLGHKHYLAHHLSREVLKYRLGDIQLQTIAYGETINKNGVEITLFPAGHVIGSAQVRVVYQGEVWVVSGDYKTEADGVCEPFEPVKCHHFISECTFGMPVYQWKPQQQLFDEMNNWWRQNLENNLATVVVGYSLGKAQRILQNLDLFNGKVYTHGVIENTNEALRRNGIELQPTTRITPDTPKEEVRKGIILAPPSAVGSAWMRKFGPYSFGYCSGWMALRGAKRRRAADRGFVLSDHADWNGLISAIDATGCECVYLTHGYTASFTRYLNEIGFNAREVHTLYGTEEEEAASPQDSPTNLPKGEASNEGEVNKVLSAGEDLGEVGILGGAKDLGEAKGGAI